MIDLSFYRRKEFKSANISYSDIDEKLLHECAYYPLPANPFFNLPSKCRSCLFKKPNLKCKHSHILTLSEIAVETVEKTLGVKKLLHEMSKEEVVELIKFVREKRRG
jgi:hypothetical protein